MALTCLFADGFDTYNSLAANWDSPGTDTAIILDSGNQRSGRGYCQITTSAFGPLKNLPGGPYSQILVTGALNPRSVAGDGQMFQISNNQGGPFLRFQYNADGSLTFNLNSGPALFTSAPGIWGFNNAYNFVALRVKFGATGHVRFWLNGSIVVDVDANLHGGTPDVITQVQLMVAGGTTTGYWDDVSFWSYDADDAFPYAPSIYPAMPIADSAPLNWVPNSGLTHYTQVQAIPQQITNNVATATVGAVDQYIHAIPANQQIPALPQFPVILAVTHNLYADLDVAGAHTIASNKAGVAGPTNFALSTSPKFYQQVYTPGLASLADLATTPFGPEVTG